MKKLLILCLAFIAGNLLSAQQTVTINAPASIAGPIVSVAAADFDFKLAPGQKITGDIVIGIDSTVSDSTSRLIGCNKISNNVTGKIVLIRRGTCNFYTKVINAQVAGAIGVLVYVRSGETPFQTGKTDTAAIKIPFAMIGYEDAQKMVKAVNAGTTTTVTFAIPSLYNPSTTYNYVSPLKDSVPVPLIVTMSNTTTTPYLKVLVKANIKSPSGILYITSGTIDTVAAKNNMGVATAPLFYPKEKGIYTVAYSNSVNTDTLFDSFIVSDYIYAQDNLKPSGFTATDSATFLNSGLVFDVGHFFQSGSQATTVTHLGFAIHNWADIPKKDTFGMQLVLFPDDYFNNYDKLDYNTIKATTKALQGYKITGLEKADSMVYVELKTPVKLLNDTTYAVIARYDGSGSANTKQPQYTSAGARVENRIFQDLIYGYNPTTQANQFYARWSTSDKNTVRAYTIGFKPLVSGASDLPAWEENQVTVFPNPISNNILSLQFNLSQNNKEVELFITDQIGRLVTQSKLTNVQKGVQEVNIGNLANGTYFVTIYGTDGWRTKLFQVVK